MDDVRTIGDNSRHFLDEPPLVVAPPAPVTIGREDLLDTGMITEQLDDDYGHYKKRVAELLAGVLRLFALCATVPVVTEHPEAPPSASNALALLLPPGGGEAQLLGATKDLTWVPIGTNVAIIMRTLAGRGAAIGSEQMAEDVTSFVKQLRDDIAPIEKSRTTEKKPFDAAATAVQTWFKARLDPLTAAVLAMESTLLTPWTNKKIAERKEAARLEALRAAEQAEAALAAARHAPDDDAVLDHAIAVGEEADRAAAAAAAAPKDLGRTRGSAGGVTSVATKWTFRVVDRDQIPRDYWILDEAALAAVARNMKDKASVPGVQFFPETSAKVRR